MSAVSLEPALLPSRDCRLSAPALYVSAIIKSGSFCNQLHAAPVFPVYNGVIIIIFLSTASRVTTRRETRHMYFSLTYPRTCTSLHIVIACVSIVCTIRPPRCFCATYLYCALPAPARARDRCFMHINNINASAKIEQNDDMIRFINDHTFLHSTTK